MANHASQGEKYACPLNVGWSLSSKAWLGGVRGRQVWPKQAAECISASPCRCNGHAMCVNDDEQGNCCPS